MDPCSMLKARLETAYERLKKHLGSAIQVHISSETGLKVADDPIAIDDITVSTSRVWLAILFSIQRHIPSNNECSERAWRPIII